MLGAGAGLGSGSKARAQFLWSTQDKSQSKQKIHVSQEMVSELRTVRTVKELVTDKPELVLGFPKLH